MTHTLPTNHRCGLERISFAFASCHRESFCRFSCRDPNRCFIRDKTPKDGKEQGITIMSLLCNITSLFFVGIVQLLSFRGGTFSGSFDLKPAWDCGPNGNQCSKTWYRSPKKTLNNNNEWLYGFEG